MVHTVCGTPIAFSRVPLLEESSIVAMQPTCWVCGHDVPESELA